MESRIHHLGKANSLVGQIICELRDQEIQQDRMRFRFNIERVGEILAYEISKDLPYTARNTVTSLGSLEMQVLSEQPVIVSILRAGLPFHQGFLRMFDHADNGFVSAFRQATRGDEFVINIEYISMPALHGRTLILLDPMIATGRSLVKAHHEMVREKGIPVKVILAGIIASEEGIAFVKENIPGAPIYVAAIDSELTAKAYIVPGLGDAGDLAFGSKE